MATIANLIITLQKLQSNPTVVDSDSVVLSINGQYYEIDSIIADDQSSDIIISAKPTTATAPITITTPITDTVSTPIILTAPVTITAPIPKINLSDTVKVKDTVTKNNNSIVELLKSTQSLLNITDNTKISIIGGIPKHGKTRRYD